MSLGGQLANLAGVHLENVEPLHSLYEKAEAKLERSDPLVKLVLVGVIAVAVYMIVQPSRTKRLLAALYFVLP